MSAKFNTNMPVGRFDGLTIDPADVVAAEGNNGRWAPHDDEAVNDLVRSYEEVGQLQPVVITRDHEKRPVLVAGYRRWKAAVRYNEKHPDAPIGLKCVLTTVNEEEAFQRNLIENLQRRETSPVDDAYNQRRLREVYGWADSRIAQFYRVSDTSVGRYKKLLTLSTDILKKVHSRELTVRAAVDLADLSPEDRREILAPAPVPTPTPPEAGTPPATEVKAPTSAEVVQKVKETKRSQGKRVVRTIGEVKAFFEERTGSAESEGMRRVAAAVLKLISGASTYDEVESDLNDLFRE